MYYRQPYHTDQQLEALIHQRTISWFFAISQRTSSRSLGIIWASHRHQNYNRPTGQNSKTLHSAVSRTAKFTVRFLTHNYKSSLMTFDHGTSRYGQNRTSRRKLLLSKRLLYQETGKRLIPGCANLCLEPPATNPSFRESVSSKRRTRSTIQAKEFPIFLWRDNQLVFF